MFHRCRSRVAMTRNTYDCCKVFNRSLQHLLTYLHYARTIRDFIILQRQIATYEYSDLDGENKVEKPSVEYRVYKTHPRNCF